MTLTFKTIIPAAASIAAIAVIERVIPAIAVGLVALAHELDPNSASAEAARRRA